jgi:peptidoglycan/xylan/chitin deacetylase (PgdA/CDA1 family)
VVGIPVALVALAFAFAMWAPTSGGSQAGEQITPVADVTTPVTTPQPSATTPSSTPTVEPSETASPTSPPPQGRSGRSDINLANPDLQVVWSIDTDDPVYFVTIDDNVLDRAVAERGLQVIRDNRIPVTAFLTTNYVSKDTEYFTEVISFGGSVQNHTVTHNFFDDPATDVKFELCTAQERLTAQFGQTPWMMRPPGGKPYMSGGNASAVEAASTACGINRILMWNVVADSGVVSFNPSARVNPSPEMSIQPGDVVLLHFWDPKFAESLEAMLASGRANGLSPAPLENYL